MKKLLLALLFISATLSAQNYQPILQPHQYFLNGSGEPCAGCSLYSYAAGTTTPLPTYTSASGASNTNPIILDVTGAANIWVGSNSYKFSLLDTNGTTLWTVDQVQGSLAAISGLLSGYAQLSGATFTGPIIGTTITAATVSGSVNGSINPKAPPYNALGNGVEVVDAVTNGTPSITSATGFAGCLPGQLVSLYPQSGSGLFQSFTSTIATCSSNAITVNSSVPFSSSGTVLDYGSDDSTAFQAAVTAASCTPSTIQLPSGIYMLSKPIVAPCSLNMSGTTSSSWIPYSRASGATLVSTVATSTGITAFSSASNTVTLTASNGLTAGQAVAFSVTAGPTCLNGIAATVSATGLSSSQFEVVIPAALAACPDGSGSATGTASLFAFQIGSPSTFYAGLNLRDFALRGDLSGSNAIFLNNVGGEGYIDRVNITLWNGNELYCNYCQDIVTHGLALTLGGNRAGSYALSIQQVSNLLHFNDTLIAACPGCLSINSALGVEFNGGHFENDDGGSNAGTLFNTNYTSAPFVVNNSVGVSFSGIKWYSNQVEQMMVTNNWPSPSSVPYTITAYGDTALGFTDNDFDNASGLGGSIWMDTFTGTGSPLLSSTIEGNRFNNADIQVPMIEQQMGVFTGNTVTCYDTPTVAAVTSVTLSGTVATITATNSLSIGSYVSFAGITGGAATGLNSGIYPVIASGLNSSAFEVSFTGTSGGPYTQSGAYYGGPGVTQNYSMGLFSGVSVDANHISCSNTSAAAKTSGYVYASTTNASAVPTVLGGNGILSIAKLNAIQDTNAWVGPTFPVPPFSPAYTATGLALNYTVPGTTIVDNSSGVARIIGIGSSSGVVGAVSLAGISPNGMVSDNYVTCFPGCTFNYPLIANTISPISARKGTFPCTGGGTIPVTNSNYISTSDVIITMNTAGGTPGPLSYKTTATGTGFSVLCAASDTSIYNYDILN